jgi:hypothetical protein
MMMFGIMEFGWLLMMRETMTNACREACRVRVLKGSTDTDARTRFNGGRGTGLTLSTSQLAITPPRRPTAMCLDRRLPCRGTRSPSSGSRAPAELDALFNSSVAGQRQRRDHV